MTLHKEYDPFDDFPTAGPVVAPTAPDGSHDDIALGAPAPEAIQNRVVAEETMALFELEDAPTAPIDTAAVKALGEQKDAEAAAEKAEAEETDAEAPVTLATIATEAAAEKPAATSIVATPAKQEAGKKKSKRGWYVGVGALAAVSILSTIGAVKAMSGGAEKATEATEGSKPAATAEAFPSTSASQELSVDLGNNTAVVGTPAAEVTEQPTTAIEAPATVATPAGEVDGEVIISPDLQKYFVNYAALGSNPEAYLETYADGLIHPTPLTTDELQKYFAQSIITLGFDSNADAAEQWVQGFVDEKLKENYSAVFNALYVNRNLKPEQQQLMAEALLKDILETDNKQEIADFVQIVQEAMANAPEGGHYEAAFEVGSGSAATGNDTFMPVFLDMDFYDAQDNYVSRIDNPNSPTVSFSTELGFVQTPNNTAALSSFLGGIEKATP